MKRFLWVAALGAAMVAGCGNEHGSVAGAAEGHGGRAAHFTGTNPAPRRSLTSPVAPLYFEANVGQADPQVRFLSRGPGYSVFLTRSGPVFGLAARSSAPVDCANHRPCLPAAPRKDLVRMAFSGANPDPVAEGVDRQRGKSHYFLGNDHSHWHPNVDRFAKVRYRRVYPGVDVVFYGNEKQLEYDFIVAPGADVRQIALDMDGARSMRIDRAGNLVLSTAGGELLQRKPVAYQQVANRRIAVDGRYVLRSDRQVGFELGKYDTRSPLVIDPMFGFSQYLGATGDDRAAAVATDADGNTYVTGWTGSIDFPIDNPVQDTAKSWSNAFITKFDAIGNVVYSTYLGGSMGDTGGSIAVDDTGHAYVAGSACSTDFPVVNAVQGHSGGGCDAFVTKLEPDGGALVYSTYVGGNGWDAYSDTDSFFGPYSVHLAIDRFGSVYLAGSTTSTDFPVANALQSTTTIPSPYDGTSDAYIVKLSPDGGSMVYSTYLGGTGTDQGHGIAVDPAGNAYLVGQTTSDDFPIANAWQSAIGNDAFNAYSDAFVSEISADGSQLVYSSYLGGSAIDIATAVAVDADGDAFVTGTTGSPGFPFSVDPSGCPAPLPSYAPDRAFVTKIAPLGAGAVYSACLRGASPAAIAIDSSGNAYLTGQTSASDLPLVAPMQARLDTGYDVPLDAFVSELSADGAVLMFSTYLGGNNFDAGTGIAVDPLGVIHVVGNTSATDFPTTNGSRPTESLDADPVWINNAFVATIQAGVELSIADFKVIEGNDSHEVTFDVHLSSPATERVSFDLDTESWAATEGEDFEGIHEQGFVIEPGQTDKAITMTIDGDAMPEAGAAPSSYPGESFLVYPSNVVGAELRDGVAVGIIGNDDAVISVDDMAVPEGTGVNESHDVAVRLSARLAVPVSFDPVVHDGSARFNDDYYVSAPTRATIQPGSDLAYVGLTLHGDGLAEPDEDLRISISNVEGATVGQAAGTFTILNDDATLSIADASVIEGDSGTKLANFTVSLAQPTTNAVTFDVATRNGTAAAGSDYLATSLAGVTILPGSRSATVSVPVKGDATIEGNETFMVVVGNVAGAAVMDATASGTIRNDDTRLSIGDISITEGYSGKKAATFTIKLSNASANVVTFSAATASKTAVAGSDYVARGLTRLGIPAGATSKTFVVSIVGDTKVEANETFLVNVSGVKGAQVADAQAVATIRNDDTVLSVADARITEGDGGTRTMWFTVKLSAPLPSPVTLGVMTVNKTAVAGSDYVALTPLPRQTIPAGGTSKVFKVMVKGDTLREPDETFVFRVPNVGSATGVSVTMGDFEATGTILNDD